MQIRSKLLLATALSVGFMGPVLAEQADNIKLYGIVDTGVYVHHASNGTTVVDMASGITKGSRWGLEGKEDLGSGYSVFFRLEQGFELDSGAAKSEGYQFYRDSYIGLNTPIGKVNVGRTGALASGNNGGIVGSMSPFGITWKEAALTKVFAGCIGSRLNNMIRFESAEFSGAKLFAQYSNGVDDDAVPSSQKDRYLALGANYQYGGLRLAFVFDNYFYNDSAAKTEAGVAAGKNLKNQRTYNLGGSYDFGTVRLYAGYQYGQNIKTPRVGDGKSIAAKYSAKNPGEAEGYDTHAVTLGTNIKLWGGELKGTLGFAHADRDYQDAKSKVYQAAIGYKYPLSKRTYAYGGVAYLNAKSGITGKRERVETRSVFAGLCHSF